MRPRVAILREQGVNGQLEMAAAFHRAGFEAVDVHMSDMLAGRERLADFRGWSPAAASPTATCSAPARAGPSRSCSSPAAREQFAAFFARPDTFTLGVCNGCQMLSTLKALIPGTEHWPRFVRNRSEQFEAAWRWSRCCRPRRSSSRHGRRVLPIVVAHGEGRAEFGDDADLGACVDGGLVSLRFVDNHGRSTETYPANPNGSPRGITGLTSRDGRVTIMMPHPERVFRTVQQFLAARRSGARTGRGCGCSATRASGLASVAFESLAAALLASRAAAGSGRVPENAVNPSMGAPGAASMPRTVSGTRPEPTSLRAARLALTRLVRWLSQRWRRRVASAGACARDSGAR